jgi:hypothetical protein
VALEDGPAVPRELQVEAQARGEVLPGVEVGRGKPVARGLAVGIQLVLLRREGLVVVVAQPDVEGEAIVDADGVVEEDPQVPAVPAVAERLPIVAEGVVGIGLRIGVHEVVVAVDAARHGVAVLHAEAEVVAGPQEVVGQVGNLGGGGGPPRLELVPVVVPAADEAGVEVVEARQVLGWFGSVGPPFTSP